MTVIRPVNTASTPPFRLLFCVADAKLCHSDYYTRLGHIMNFRCIYQNDNDFVEETVRPIPFIVVLILWLLGLYVSASTIALLFCKPIRGWGLFFHDGYVEAIFCSVILLLLTGFFTAIFILFKGVRYRIFMNRIEFQQGKHPVFGPVQTLSFDELEYIYWNIQGLGDENLPDSMFIELGFASRLFQLHKTFKLADPVAEICRKIEREVIAPGIIRRIEEGETVSFVRPDKYPSYDIRIDKEGIKDWDQHQILWNEILRIQFSKGEESRCGNFLAQSRIRLESTFGESIEFDMPRRNPHALWEVVKMLGKSALMDIASFPKEEPQPHWRTRCPTK